MSVRSILVVHPDFEAKRRLVKFLIDHQCEVVPARTIRQALGYLRVRTPHLLLTHEFLPDGNVDTLLQSLRASTEWKLLPCVVMTQGASEERFLELEKSGATTVLPLPWDADGLLEVIRNLTEVRLRQEEGALGISGQLARFGIMDLIQEMAREHGSGRIAIDGSIPMQIHLAKGEIVHAKHGITVGLKALYRCLRIADAAYHFSAIPFEGEPSIQKNMQDLLREARESNQKLMANLYLMPQLQHRLRIKSWDLVRSIKFTAEAQAALEVIKRFPLVRDYLDNLNLPDSLCYEYLMTFKERGLIEVVTTHRPVGIITDSACDLGLGQLDQLKVSYVPLRLVGEQGEIADSPRYLSRFGEAAKGRAMTISALEGHSYADKNMALLPSHDCLNLVSEILDSPFASQVRKQLEKVAHLGLEGQPLMASELMIVESGQFSLGLAALVCRASAWAAAGDSIEVLRDKLNRLTQKLTVLYALPVAKSLLGGRLAFQVKAWVPPAFKDVAKLARGEDLSEALTKLTRERLSSEGTASYWVGHIQAEEQAQTLMHSLQKNLPQATGSLLAMGPISAQQLGFGVVGIAFFGED